jgi:hypothetical protein
MTNCVRFPRIWFCCVCSCSQPLGTRTNYQRNIGNSCYKRLSLCLILTEHHAMKAYWGVELLLHSFFNLDTRWRWVVSSTPRPLYPQGNRPWYSLVRKLGGSQSLPGRGGEEKNSQHPPWIELCNPDRLARSPALYRLSCHGPYKLTIKCIINWIFTWLVVDISTDWTVSIWNYKSVRSAALKPQMNCTYFV